MTTDTTTLAALTSNLHHLADVLTGLDLETPIVGLPFMPYISSSYDGTLDAHWFVQNHADDVAEQKVMAAQIVRVLGGSWAKSTAFTEGDFQFTRRTGGVSLVVTVEQAAVCRRVVTGTHEVTVPATPAIPAEPERVEQVETVTWECGSLLAALDNGPSVVSA